MTNILLLAISRNRPLDLAATLVAFRRLESGNHKVHIATRCDLDDEPTIATANLLGETLTGPRPLTLGQALNSSLSQITFPWEILQIIPDDIQPISPHWDHRLVDAATVHPAASWTELADPSNPTLPFLTRKWVDAIGRAMPEHFPFWFNDTWIAEVFALAFDKPFPILQQLQWAGRRGLTTNMRDLPFWLDVFIATRPERIEEARRLAPAIAEGNLQTWLQRFAQNDAWLRANAPGLEERLRDPRDPSEAYLEAKRRAEALLTTSTPQAEKNPSKED